jgi:uncharacterized FAD-dependent dehydrogenase
VLSPGSITNGWSPSKRDQATANSGIVVELKLEDFKPFAKHGALAIRIPKVLSKSVAASR